MNKNKRKIVKCDLNGNIISEFNTLVEAGNEIGVTKHIIFKCCKDNKKIVNDCTYHYINIIEDNIESVTKLIKCPYCDRTFDTYNGLSKHIIRFKAHGEISQEKLLSDYKYDGKRPLCACGCGKETEIGYQGETHFNELIQGHYSKVHNNWGHNQKALDHSAETRRIRFKSGDIMQWNKGKKWDETYTDEQISKLLKKYENKKFAKSSNIERLFASSFLDTMGIEYESQKYIKEIRQFSDFYCCKSDTYIEFNGDFWHCNPIKYPNGPKYKCQINKAIKDKIKLEWMNNNHKKIIIIWEDDFKYDKEKILKQLECLIKQNETTY